MFTKLLKSFGLMRVSMAREINEEIAAADFRAMERHLAGDAPHLVMRPTAEQEHRDWANTTFDQVIVAWEEEDYIITEFELLRSKL